MANVDRPNGMVPVRYASGKPYNGAFNTYLVQAADATALYLGDIVDLDGDAGGAGEVVYGVDVEGIASVTKAAVAGPILGVVVGFSPDQDNLTKRYRAAAEARLVYVADDPALLFEVQEVSGGTALTSAAVGLNTNLVGTGGSTVTGISAMEVDNTTEATTNTLAVRLVGLSKRPDNAFGEHAKWLVQINDHRNAMIGGAGPGGA